ncbi:histidine kinase [Salinarimonas soli]|uniref:Histidine kinase n=1 Tax=Salinarimonas soli TaxID=1638099 RepID=A0A5B2VCN9_9HYPH|nr:histidine kinase [Salinarimonas soli]KAA2236821.1 histidine kinase [Salinarimonas soli]
MPTLFRFLLVLLVLGGIGVGAMLALATFVTPQPREMTETVPATRLMPQR